MTWDRPYSYSYPKNLDPLDTQAFAEGYARLRQQGSPQVSGQTETPLSRRPTAPEASPAQDDLRNQPARRKKAPSKEAKPPRVPDILQKLRNLTLCRPRGHEVDGDCIQRRGASSGSASNATFRIDRAQNSSASPERVYVPPPGSEHEGEVNVGWQPMPTSPGTWNDWAILAQSWAAHQDSDSFAGHDNWNRSMEGHDSSAWQPLSPAPIQGALHAWEEAEAAQAAQAAQAASSWGHAGTSSQAPAWEASAAGPSSSAPALPEVWANYGFNLPPQGHGMGMDVHREMELMEQTHADLFASPSIASVNRRRAVVPPVASTRDVDLKECIVVNTARGDNDSIGTMGVATCFALCARGQNSEGETILGLLHYTGDDEDGRRVAPGEALHELHHRMHAAGARDVSVNIVGGMASPDPFLSTLPQEWEFLSLRNAFNIEGARLHVNSAEEMGEEAYVNVLLTPDQVYFSQKRLYDCD